MTTVLCIPQWQASASRNSSRLVAGARRTAGLVEAEALITVPVLETGGDKKAGIRALDALLEKPETDPAGPGRRRRHSDHRRR
jgi:arginase